jgi:hypothetical protein
LAGADDNARSSIHVDGQSYWSGIVYLTLPERCRGGTEFYRHRELQGDHAPLYDKDVKKIRRNVLRAVHQEAHPPGQQR